MFRKTYGNHLFTKCKRSTKLVIGIYLFAQIILAFAALFYILNEKTFTIGVILLIVSMTTRWYYNKFVKDDVKRYIHSKKV